MRSTKIDKEVIVVIIAKTGAALDNVLDILGKHGFVEKTLVDIGVLRFPDAQNPFVKVRNPSFV